MHTIHKQICLFTDYECQPSKYPTSLWPGPPGYLPYNITYHIIGNKCVASPRLQWMIPNDSKYHRIFKINLYMQF